MSSSRHVVSNLSKGSRGDAAAFDQEVAAYRGLLAVAREELRDLQKMERPAEKKAVKPVIRFHELDEYVPDSSKDLALRQVALDAANRKNPEIIKEALSKMGRLETKDQTAADCAVTLATNNAPPAAMALVYLISGVTIREETLRKIAMGSSEHTVGK